MQTAWSSPNPASIYFFRDLMMEFVDLLSSQSMLKLQTKPMPALTVPLELKDIVEEEMKPGDLVKEAEAMKASLRSASPDSMGLTSAQRAMADHVLFEEDDDTGSGLFRVVCRLNRDAKVAFTIAVLNNVANGLDCSSFTILKTNKSATVKVVMRSGVLIDLIMTVGLNEEKQRVLHGTYPESHATYGRSFWIRFAETLAAQGLLLGQALSVPQPAAPRPAPSSSGASSSSGVSPRTAAANAAAEEENADDSGLEYDSDNYDNSEGSVDSDTD